MNELLKNFERLDARTVPNAGVEIRAFLLVRNELLRLPQVFEHYRELGVKRFFVVDNGSTDGSAEFVVAQPDAHVFATSQSYAASRCGLNWLNALLDVYGSGHWALSIDADELFIYPGYEKLKLPDLCRYLDQTGSQAMFALLLDMYSDKAIVDTTLNDGQTLLDACPYFDPAPYVGTQAQSFPHLLIYGGVRGRLFSHFGVNIDPPTVSKVPLVKWAPGVRYILSTHAMTPPVEIAELGGALLHFKFLSDFRPKAHIESERREHFAQAREYRVYNEILKRIPDLCLKNSNSVRFTGGDQLVDLNLMKSSADYQAFMSRVLSAA